ncbi:MAG: hypothetical protein MO846_11835 [Candidatus Devosia symbiotica]|nr:hypothetical protein [Candidatus Devosia symbiotica]
MQQHHGEVSACNNSINGESQHQAGKFEPGKVHRAPNQTIIPAKRIIL